MRVSKSSFDHILTNMLPILWRRRGLICAMLLVTSCAAFGFYSLVGDRYEVYTLMRVGQGIKERATAGTGGFGETVDLVSRIDSLARIGTTDQVIREAMQRIGTDRLFGDTDMTLATRLRSNISEFLGLPKKVPAPDPNNQEAIAALRDLITARQEGRSDLLRLSFRFTDPVVAAEFLNELANSLVGAQAGLVQLPGADIFFQQQAKRLEQEAEVAAAALKDYSVAASIYSSTEQRALLLKQAHDLSSLIAMTRGSIEDRKGQKQAIVDHLSILRPVTQSKTVSSMVSRIGGLKLSKTNEDTAQFEETPPLLLVKVYQDAMANLMKVNSDLLGAQKLEASLSDELHNLNAQLADLTSKEAEYDRLKRVLTRASSAADYYGTRMMDEQISLDSAKKTQLSSVRVVQLADKPTAPMFPRINHLVALALLGGLALGATMALLLELARFRQQQDDEVDRFVASKLSQFSGRNSAMAAE